MTSSSTLVGRSTSPTPSVQSAYSREQGQNSPGPQTNKRSLFDKIRRPKAHGPLKHFQGLQDSSKSSLKMPRREASPRRGRQGSLESTSASKYGDTADERKKDRSLAIGSGKLRGRRGADAAGREIGKAHV